MGHAAAVGTQERGDAVTAARRAPTTKKPVRSANGVAPVSVLLAPHPCPGKCSFCPTDEAMPKSYLASEPIGRFGASHEFDPFRQVRSRIESYEADGHSTSKLELIVMGGTWTSYPLDYQEWFMKRCTEAINGYESDSMSAALAANASAKRRNVTTIIETRPEHITPKTVQQLRAQGVTKVQIGIPSLREEILTRTNRGHTAAQAKNAVNLLRREGFKIGVEWMPNLPGSTVEDDLQEYLAFWTDPDLMPDDIKIFPCRLLPGTTLFDEYQAGRYRPYSNEELVWLLKECVAATPEFARIARIGRSFPGNVTVDKRPTNLYELVKNSLARERRKAGGLRERELRHAIDADPATKAPNVLSYPSREGVNHFISVRPAHDPSAIIGFCRVFVPFRRADFNKGGDAVIRALNVVGPSAPFGPEAGQSLQHEGVGSFMLSTAERIAALAGCSRVFMNSAIGVRNYYERRGYASARTTIGLMPKDLRAF